MLGDQVYMDFGDSSADRIWPWHLHSTPTQRRQAMVLRYQQHWARDVVRRILANYPIYMLWSDHEIRDGWGSWASDSPTLQAKYPRGAQIAAAYNSYFYDAQDLYWHFQACHNPAPPNFIVTPPPRFRQAMPFVFRCGRLAVVMLDDRGDRDLWRDSGAHALGHAQWMFLEQLLTFDLPCDIDVLVLAMQAPIVSMSPTGETMRLLADRVDDVDLFKQGNAEALLALQESSASTSDMVYEVVVNRLLSRGTLPHSDYHLSDFDDARDQWSHPYCREEQEKIVRVAAVARTTNRPTGSPRRVMFVGGDIHSGALFDIRISDPMCTIPCVISSGIGQSKRAVVGVKIDDEFEVAPGIWVELNQVVGDFNFAVTTIVFGGASPLVSSTIAHPGMSNVYRVNLI